MPSPIDFAGQEHWDEGAQATRADFARRIFELTDRLTAGLRRRPLEIIGPWGSRERSAIAVFRPGAHPRRLSLEANRCGFILRTRSGGVRVASYFYNTEDDINRLLGALDELHA